MVKFLLSSKKIFEDQRIYPAEFFRSSLSKFRVTYISLNFESQLFLISRIHMSDKFTSSL